MATLDWRQFMKGERTRERFWQMNCRDRNETWSNLLTGDERRAIQDLDGLTRCLLGYEGWRVEVRRNGVKYRFIVGRSTGYRPAHLEIKSKRSLGGDLAANAYDSVKPIERVF